MEGKKLFSCPVCDKKFSFKFNIKPHISSVHEKNKPYKCLDCNFSFSQKGQLKNHYLSRHDMDLIQVKDKLDTSIFQDVEELFYSPKPSKSRQGKTILCRFLNL